MNIVIKEADKEDINNGLLEVYIEGYRYHQNGRPDIFINLSDDTLKEEKTNSLIERINNSNIPQGIKDFLIKASYRHLAFNYQNIAEYYAHADKEVQELMEESALVIIDYDSAVRNGYVQIKEAINEMIEEGVNDEE